MLSLKRLTTFSTSKISSNVHLFKRNVLENNISKHCDCNLLNICRSLSVLHNLTKKSKHPVSIFIFVSFLLRQKVIA